MRDSLERKRQKEDFDRMFKEILRNRLRLTWGLPEVLSMAPIVQILNRWVCPELLSLSLLRIYLLRKPMRERKLSSDQ
jgi:hypothetical protein